MARLSRAALAAAGVAGVVLLVAATFSPVIEITVGGSGAITADFDRSLSGYDRHSVALLLIAAFAAGMLAGALRGARPAMLAVAACGVAVLLIAVLADVPDLDRTGPIGELYEDARAEAGSGFYLETLGGALLLIAGGGLLALGGGASVPSGGRPGRENVSGDTGVTPVAPAGGTRPAAPAPAPAPREEHPSGVATPAMQAPPAPTPAQPAGDDAGLSFDERLRRARERARGDA